MTTIMLTSTFDMINDIVANLVNYEDRDKYEVMVYNDSDPDYIILSVTLKTSSKELFSGKIVNK